MNIKRGYYLTRQGVKAGVTYCDQYRAHGYLEMPDVPLNFSWDLTGKVYEDYEHQFDLIEKLEK